MTDYTPILHLPQVAPNQDQKEATINTAIAILEAAMNDTLSYDVTAPTQTLTTDDFTKFFLLQFTGTPPADAEILVPNTQRWFAVENQSDELLTLRVDGAVGGQAIDIAPGKIGLVVSDGFDLRFVVPDPTGGLGLLADLSDVSGVPTDGQLLRWYEADANWKPWTFSLMWDDIVDAPDYLFTGNQGMLLAVKMDGSGLEWVSNASNVNSFTDLDDAPGSYSGHANKHLVVNSGATGVTFAVPNLRENSDFPVTYSGQDGKFLKVKTGGGVEFGMPKVADLTDGPGQSTFGDALWYVRVNAAGTGLEYAPGSGGPVNFTELLDTPNTFDTFANKIVRVGADEDQLIFDDLGLLELNDTPNTYSGQAAKFLRVNSGQSGIEFGGATVQDLSNGPGAFAGKAKQVVRVNATANALEYVALSILDLANFPTSFGGQGGKFLQVRADETGVQFVSNSFTASFLALTDTPSSYSGQANKMVVVDGSGTGLVFAARPATISVLNDLADVDTATGTPGQGAFLRYIDGVWQSDIVPIGDDAVASLGDLTDVEMGTGVPTVGYVLTWKDGVAQFEPPSGTSDVQVLGDLTDVEMGTALVEGYVLTYRDGVWQAEPGGTSNVENLDDVEDVTITTPTDGQVLTFRSGEWVNETQEVVAALSDLTDVEMGTGTPTEGYVLTWKDGVAQFEPGGSSDVQSLGDLTDVEMGTALVEGYVLTYRDGVWQAEPGGTSNVGDLGDLGDVDFSTGAIPTRAVLTYLDGVWQAEPLPLIPTQLGQLTDVELGTGTPAAGSVLTYKDGVWQTEALPSTSFLNLTDTPAAYTGHGGKVVRVNAGATALEFDTFASGDLADVDYTTPPADGQVLVWDAGTSKFVPSALAGSSLASLSDVDVTGVQHGRVLTYDNNEEKWIPGETFDVDMPEEDREGGAILVWDGEARAWTYGTLPEPLNRFTDLVDAPDYYSGAGNLVAINSAEDGLTFSDLSVFHLQTMEDFGAHAYWRIAMQSPVNTDDYPATRLGIADLYFKPFPNADHHPFAGGTALGSTPVVGTTLADAFDEDSETAWVSDVESDGDAYYYLGYHFTAPVSVQEVSIVAPPEGFAITGSAGPSSFDVEYSDDGFTWTVAWSDYNAGSEWPPGYYRTFYANPSSGLAFRALQDTPHSYIGQAGYTVRVNATEDGLEFAEAAGGAESLVELNDVMYPTGTPVDNAVLTWSEADGQWVPREPSVVLDTARILSGSGEPSSEEAIGSFYLREDEGEAWIARSSIGSVSDVKTTYSYTGAEEEFTVPYGYDSMSVKLWGGAGGGGSYAAVAGRAGAGGFTTVTIPVTAGDVIKVEAPSGGQGGNPVGPGGLGGWPDGGYGTFGDVGGGGGGGSARVWKNGILQAVAGGGGGGTGYSSAAGAGGGTTGQSSAGGDGGTGGSQIAGGYDGNDSAITAKQGSALLGGQGGNQTRTDAGNDDGGGGGGGYYGGGGGGGDGRTGGGGSGHVRSGLVGNTYAGSGHLPPTEATDDPDYQIGISLGPVSASSGTGANGGNGQVVVEMFAIPGAGGWRRLLTTDDAISNLTDLADVDLSTGAPADGDVLTYRDGVWQAEASAGGGGGASALSDLTDVEMGTGTPTEGYVLTWKDGVAQFEPASTGGGGAASLSDLTDVEMDTGTPTDGYVLTWKDGVAQFEPAPVIGGVTTLTELTDVDVATGTPSSGSVLTYKDGIWQAEMPVGGGGGGSDFLALSDTPNDYTGKAGSIVAVNDAEDGLDFTGLSLESFAIPPEFGAHSYWRAVFTEADGGDNDSKIALRAMYFRTSIGGANINVGGSGFGGTGLTSGSDGSSFHLYALYDSGPTLGWTSSRKIVDGAGPAYLGYNFPTPYAIAEVAFRWVAPSYSYTLGPAPSAFTIQFSDDGISWTDAYTASGSTGWSRDETRAFHADSDDYGLAFRALEDTPSSFVSHGGKYLRVNSAESALEYAFPDLAAIFNKTASFTLDVTQRSGLIRANSASSIVATVPWNIMPVGASISIMQEGAGALTLVAASGVTFRYPSDKTLAARTRYSVVKLTHFSANEWVVSGDLA